jgi:lysophospholipase L1-like esterase
MYQYPKLARTATGIRFVTAVLLLATGAVATASAASPPPTPLTAPSPLETPATLPPDGTWQVELSEADLSAAGWSPDVTPPGTYSWIFGDGHARIELQDEAGVLMIACEATMVPVEDRVRLTYAGGACGGEVDDVRWRLDPEGLHLSLVTTNAPVEQQRAYLETKPWQAVEPSSPPASDGAGWTYVALGDSLLYALAEDCSGCTSAADLYGERITADTGVPVEVQNLTMHDGSTSTMLRDAIVGDGLLGRTAQHARQVIAGADIISVSIGFNDALTDPLLASYAAGTCGGTRNVDCFLGTVPALESNVDAILTEIDALRADSPTAVRVLTIYNNAVPEPGGPEPFGDPPGTGVGAWRDLAEAQNAALCRVALAHDAVCVDIYHAFNGPDGMASSLPLLAPDMTHPSQLGMDTIAQTMAAAGYAPLR